MSTPSRVFWALLILAVLSAGARWSAGMLQTQEMGLQRVWRYEQQLELRQAPGEFRLFSWLPQEGPQLALLDEDFEVGGLRLSVQPTASGRQWLIEGPAFGEVQRVFYRATLRLSAANFELPDSLAWDSIPTQGEGLGATEAIQCEDERLQIEMAGRLGQSDWLATQGGAADAPQWRRHLESQGIGPLAVLEAAWGLAHDDIQSAGYSGTTDALTALALGRASCGGKSRLMVAMLRAAGIPARLVGGIILEAAARKRTSHVWIEAQLAGDWVPFDPLNHHYASRPEHYLTLHNGDEAILRYSRGLALGYQFLSDSEWLPGGWARGEESSWRLPLLRQHGFSLIVLAPFALLMVVFLRQVIGLRSMGIFLPVLIAFSLRETGLMIGALQLGAAIAAGITSRLLFGRVARLSVPRNALLISSLVTFFLVFGLLLERFGLVTGTAAVLLPVAALAMIAEKYGTVSQDVGHREALVLLGETLLIAAACWVVLGSLFLKVLTVALPEILLLVLAELVIVGNHRGRRLRELWRFRDIQSRRPA